MSPRSSSTQGMTLLAASLALFLVFLDNTIVNVALPTIQHELAAGPDALEWTVSAYVVAFAALILFGGALGDRYGHRRMFSVGLLSFGAGSVASALADSGEMLIAGRATQGIGAALLAPLSLALLARAFPREQLPKAIGVWAGVSGLGLAVGPLVGGALVDHVGWQAIFWINVPIVGAALAITALGVNSERTRRPGKLDVPGAVLATAGLALLVAGLIRTTVHSWDEQWTVLLVATGIVTLVGFLLRQRLAQSPLLPLSLLRDREFAGASSVLALAMFALFGTLWFVTLYLQNVRGYTAIAAGVRTLPLTLMTLLVAPVAGKRMPQLGARRLATTGLTLAAAGLVVATRLTPSSSYWLLAAALALVGAGLALALPVAAAVAVSRTEAERLGTATGIATSARQLGGAIGLAVLAPLGAHVTASRFGTDTQPQLLQLVKGGQTAAIGALVGPHAQTAAAAAFTAGMTRALWIAAAALAAAALVGVRTLAGAGTVRHPTATGRPLRDLEEATR